MMVLYAPLDGMNEQGLVVSVNMIPDNATINQDTDKPDITTTTAIRLLLNRAATVEEALKLLEEYDMNASMGYMVHLAIADKDGNSVVVEYVDNEMIVIETPVVTNFYLAEGEKNGIGTSQSHTRYDILINLLEQNETMSMTDVRDALSDLTQPGVEYTPFASVSEICAQNSITCVAPSKAFNLAGLQTASVFIPNPVLRHKVNRGLNTDEVRSQTLLQ